jgi:hypothetical protein
VGRFHLLFNISGWCFYDYSLDLIKRVEREMVHEILSSRELKLENEDTFLTMLIDLGTDFSDFLQSIDVTNLTEDGIGLFVNHLPFNEMAESIWRHVITL